MQMIGWKYKKDLGFPKSFTNNNKLKPSNEITGGLPYHPQTKQHLCG